MPKCPQCGELNPSGVGMCKKCGAELPNDELPTPADEEPRDDDIVALLRSGRKIQAVRVYRERTGCGLKEAKDAVEEVARRHQIVARGAGCAGVLAVLLLVVAMLVAIS